MDLLPWMERWGMLPPKGGVLLCAVSGGRDSVCLLHYLAAIAPQRGFTVAAGHLNHQMRPEARRDEDFVRELCRTLGVAFYTEAAPMASAVRNKNSYRSRRPVSSTPRPQRAAVS